MGSLNTSRNIFVIYW